MQQAISRRGFVKVATSGCALAAASFTPLAIGQQEPSENKPLKPLEKGPSLDAELVRQTVGASHRDLEKVRELITLEPELANGCWDWGGGDYETPLGAAAHTGQIEIARFLLERGARLDIFAATMLGMTTVVKAAIEVEPNARYTLGPHGITLIRHAEAGGDAANDVKAYLEQMYAQDSGPRDLYLSPRALNRYVGKFTDAADASTVHEFQAIEGHLQWMKSDAELLQLLHRGNHEFASPGDTAATKLTFSIRNNFAQTVVVEWQGKTTTANRAV